MVNGQELRNLFLVFALSQPMRGLLRSIPSKKADSQLTQN